MGHIPHFTTSTAEHFFSFRHTIFHNSTLTMSSAAIPKTTKAWTVEGQDGFESLKLNNEAPIPDLFDNEVLVKFHAASLNYRDLIIPKGMYPFAQKQGVVPGSDGADEVVAVGKNVTRFQPGSKVVTLFNQGHLAGSLDTQAIATGLGGVIDGTLRQYGTFNEAGLVEMPESLNWQEASTLSCAAVTAWNALYGLKPLVPGDVVLTQGTGGVFDLCCSVRESGWCDGHRDDVFLGKGSHPQEARCRPRYQLQRRSWMGRESRISDAQESWCESHS